jgi:hypothetical protein
MERQRRSGSAIAARWAGMAHEGHVASAVRLVDVLATGQRSIDHLGGWMSALVHDQGELPPQRALPSTKRMALARLVRWWRPV